jgi:SAM-dependent methyltransferase
VIALDRDVSPLLAGQYTHEQTYALCADGASLPFADGAFDMVYCQLVLLWVATLDQVIGEVWRVLQPGGVFIAIEPDYGGMIEYPAALATRDLWITALTRAGANPTIGRVLPSVLERQGFAVRVDLLPELVPPSPTRFALLRGLPLTRQERAKLDRIAHHDAAMSNADRQWSRVVHLPFVLVTAERKG